MRVEWGGSAGLEHASRLRTGRVLGSVRGCDSERDRNVLNRNRHRRRDDGRGLVAGVQRVAHRAGRGHLRLLDRAGPAAARARRRPGGGHAHGAGARLDQAQRLAPDRRALEPERSAAAPARHQVAHRVRGRGGPPGRAAGGGRRRACERTAGRPGGSGARSDDLSGAPRRPGRPAGRSERAAHLRQLRGRSLQRVRPGRGPSDRGLVGRLLQPGLLPWPLRVREDAPAERHRLGGVAHPPRRPASSI